MAETDTPSNLPHGGLPPLEKLLALALPSIDFDHKLDSPLTL
jgi:hypothetical protein